MYSLKNYLRIAFLPENSSLLLSLVCFALGVLSIIASIGLFVVAIPFYKDITSTDINMVVLFLGLWAPTLISIANYFKK